MKKRIKRHETNLREEENRTERRRRKEVDVRGMRQGVCVGGEGKGKEERNEADTDRERKRRRLRKYQQLIGGNMEGGRRPHFDLLRPL